MKIVKPKQIELEEAKGTSAAAQKVWDDARARLKAVED